MREGFFNFLWLVMDAMAKTDLEIQVHGMGPFKLTYVNPADDPSTREAKK